VCQTGGPLCRRSLLTPAEAAEVAAIEHQRDVLACRSDVGYCDRSLLSASEAKEVANAKRHRNALACYAGDRFL
jgi:hypothetical protein